MLYYLMLVPAVLSTAVIYFLSPALSYWWLLPVLLGCFVAANLVYVLLMFVCSLFAGPNRMYDRISPFYLALTLALDGWILALCRIKIHVEGLEKVPTDSEFLFVSNHRSNFDPIIQWTVLPQWEIAFISKEGNFRIPFFGRFIRKCCFLSIDRSSPKRSVETMRKAEQLLGSGEVSVGVYPEGTRSKSGELLPFHCGMFRIAQKAGAPIAVMAIRGTEQIHKNIFRRRTDVYLNIAGIIPAERVAEMQARDIGAEVELMLRRSLDGGTPALDTDALPAAETI